MTFSVAHTSTKAQQSPYIQSSSTLTDISPPKIRLFPLKIHEFFMKMSTTALKKGQNVPSFHQISWKNQPTYITMERGTNGSSLAEVIT